MEFIELILIVLSLVLTVPLILAVAFYTLGERKFMASVQRRVGPNVNHRWGLLQPLADGLKLIIKELIIPAKADNFFFMFAPFLTFFLSLAG